MLTTSASSWRWILALAMGLPVATGCPDNGNNNPDCVDLDGDGFGSPGSAACAAGPATDCDDANAAVNPGAPELVCNGVDDNCDGVVDENRTVYAVDSQLDSVDLLPGDGVCNDGTGGCTLRAAIQEANACAGPDAIALPAGTYALTLAGAGEDQAATGDLDIRDDLTIAGAGAAVTIIDGGGLDRVFHIPNLAVTASIAGVTITHGYAGDATSPNYYGGGIFNYAGTLTVTDSVITGNTANSGSAGMGGGIHNWAGATLTIRNSTLSNNAAYNSGGALYNNGSSATLTNCTVTGNVSNTGHGGSGGGGAIISVTAGAQLVVDGSTISGNTATTGAGGFLYNGAVATVTNSTISGNSAEYGGGIGNQGTVTVTGSAIEGNSCSIWGGGVYNFAGGNTATFATTEISGNAANSDGGGIYNREQSHYYIDNPAYVHSNTPNDIVDRNESGGD